MWVTLRHPEAQCSAMLRTHPKHPWLRHLARWESQIKSPLSEDSHTTLYLTLLLVCVNQGSENCLLVFVVVLWFFLFVFQVTRSLLIVEKQFCALFDIDAWLMSNAKSPCGDTVVCHGPPDGRLLQPMACLWANDTLVLSREKLRDMMDMATWKNYLELIMPWEPWYSRPGELNSKVHRRPVSLPRAADSESTDLQIAFRQNDQKEQLPAFAWLPLRSYGLPSCISEVCFGAWLGGPWNGELLSASSRFRFIVQADWEVSSSREAILAERSRNQCLRSSLPEMFCYWDSLWPQNHQITF